MKKELVNFENKKIKDVDINENIFCLKVFQLVISSFDNPACRFHV